MAPRSPVVAKLDALLLAQLGGQSGAVQLSPQTATKQSERHPHVSTRDYARLQSLIDQGMVFLEKTRTLVFVGELDEGKWWRAVVKRTANGRETFLVTFHRINPGQVAAAYRRGHLVRPAKRTTAPGGAQSLLARPRPRV